MKSFFSIIVFCLVSFSWAQDAAEKDKQIAMQKANAMIYEANELIDQDDYISAEMEYRKAISEQPNHAIGAYNLGTSYYQKGNLDEALFRLQQAAKSATSKEEKHRAFHNIGNILYENKRCQEAVEAYKNALRNDPSDDETRYNYALAKECAEKQKGKDDEKKKEEDNQEKKDDQDQQDDQQDQQDNQDDQNKDNKDNKDQDNQDKKEGDKKEDEKGKPKDDKQDQNENDGGSQDKKQPQPKQGQLSPQQIKNLLEAMNNQEEKVQEKMNAKKQKGIKIKTDKDW